MSLRGEEAYSHEHTLALLADDELSEDTLSSGYSSSQPSSSKGRWRSWLYKALLCVVILFSIALIASGTVRRSHRASESKMAAVFQDDYILDMRWDYTAAAQVREYEWTLKETEFNPDGVFRPMLLINNQFPGPLIEVNGGDTIRVIVHNHMSNSTSIHWHGIYQNGTNFMDGTAGITQCPIAPGSTFVYEFNATGQSGTYWYHAHQGTQTSDGLAGPLIIHHRDEHNSSQLDYSSDRIVMLSDHYHRLSSALTKQYLAPDMENTEPVPDGALINGRGIRDCDTLPSNHCDNTTITQLQFHIQPQTRQRIRIINIGAFAQFQFQIDEHDLAIIEVDGTEVLPSYHHRLNISPAQRYSILIHANQTHRNDFRIRARMLDDCFAGYNPNMIKEVEAIVSYTTATDHTTSTTTLASTNTPPDSLDWSEPPRLQCQDMNTTELIPIKPTPIPTKEDVFFYLRLNFQIGAYRLSRGYFNDSTWTTPDISSPSLFQYIDKPPLSLPLPLPPSSPPSPTNTIPSPLKPYIDTSNPQLTILSPKIATIDLLIHNTDDSPHPLHLHGHKFFILSQGKGYPPRTSVLEGVSRTTVQPIYDNLDLANPLSRDTASVEADSWILLRFITDNVGVWAFHCHVNWHAEAGLMMQVVGRADELRTIEVPGGNRELFEVDREVLELGMGPKAEDYWEEAVEGSERNGSGCEGESVRDCSYDY